MAERFDYPETGAASFSWAPDFSRDQQQSSEIYNDGVVYEQSAGLTEYRYAEGVRTIVHKAGYTNLSHADKLAFIAFKNRVAGRRFRLTDYRGLTRRVTFTDYQIEFKSTADRWNWGCALREEDPAPGLERVPTDLYPDLLFYLRAENNLTAYGLGAIAPTFARASIATFTDPYDGLIKTAAAGVARFEAAGLLMEGARTNLCLRSEDFTNASWNKTLTVTANDAIAPDGNETADLLTATEANNLIGQNFSATTNVSKVWSLYLKRKTGTGNIQLSLDNGSNYTTVTVTSEWTRVSLIQTLTNANPILRIVTSGDEIWAWGSQLEDNATFASSYIPTTSASVARAADTLSFESSGNADETEGAAIAVVTPAALDDAVAQVFMQIDDESNDNRHAIGSSSSGNSRPLYSCDSGGVNQASLVLTAGIDDFALATAKSLGFTWQANDLVFYTTGVSRATDSSATMPSVTRILINGGNMFAYLRDLAIFNRVLSAAEMLSVHNGII